jgi:hypothetical protein
MATAIFATTYALGFPTLLMCMPSLCNVNAVAGLSFNYCSLENIAGLELQGNVITLAREFAI